MSIKTYYYCKDEKTVMEKSKRNEQTTAVHHNELQVAQHKLIYCFGLLLLINIIWNENEFRKINSRPKGWTDEN